MNDNSNIAPIDFTKENVNKFLEYRNITHQSFSHGTSKFILFKTYCDPETDLIYSLDSGGLPYNGTDFEGYYSLSLHKIAVMGPKLKGIYGEACSAKKLIQDFSESVSKTVDFIASNKLSPEIANPRAPLNYYVNKNAVDYIEEEAMNCFYEDKYPELDVGLSRNFIDPWEIKMMLRILNHSNEAVLEYAQEYIKNNAKQINERIWEIEGIQKCLQEIKNTPGFHHEVKRILKLLGEHEIVTVYVTGAGVNTFYSAEVGALKETNTIYKMYHIPAPLGANEEELSKDGVGSSLIYVHRIMHGDEVLYQADENT